MIPIHDFQINTQLVISHSSKRRVEGVLLTLVNDKVYLSLRTSWIPRISLQNYWMLWVKRLRNDIFRRRHWKSIYWKNLPWSTTYALPISSFHSKKINKPWYVRRVLIWNHSSYVEILWKGKVSAEFWANRSSLSTET